MRIERLATFKSRASLALCSGRLLGGVVIAGLLRGAAIAGALEDCVAASGRQDYAAAIQLCRPSAEQGGARAQTRLASMYYNGQSVQRNYAEAANWVRRAAEQGYAPAQTYLGVMYWNGQGVPQDAILAYMWLNLAWLASRRRHARPRFGRVREVHSEIKGDEKGRP
jgi:Sel1 repeat